MKSRRVLIVGGGSAAWMTAAYLNAALNRDGRRAAEIGVIPTASKPDEGSVEATTPDINRFLAVLGVDQLQFLRQTGGTLRQGTRFVNWLNGKGEEYYHPFDMERTASIDRSVDAWLKSNRSVGFAETISVQPALCKMKLSPAMLSRWDFGPPLPYAFHVDVSGFTAYMKDIALRGGVTSHPDAATDAAVTDDGKIAAVLTTFGQRIEADLYIDCSGAEGLLIDKLGVGWVDQSRYLLCDRAISVGIPYQGHYAGHVNPYTTATASSSGWVRDIPLQDGRVLDYFYSSAFQSDEAAQRELRHFHGAHGISPDEDVAHKRTGHRAQAWVGNCVAIGGSCNAIESPESTNLYLIDHAASKLAEHFPLGDQLEPLAFRYNRIMANRFYEDLDFANLHFCLTRRSDTEFWNEVRRSERITSRVRAKLDFWRLKRPTPSDFEDQKLPGQADEQLREGITPGDYRGPIDTAGLWTHENYEAVMYGMDFLSEECDQRFGRERPGAVVPRHIAARVAQAQRKLPPHAAWLQKMAGMPDYPKR
jgi:tryptophan halogenase